MSLKGFLRFFTVLVIVESVTIGVTLLLLDFGISRWTDSKAHELERLAPRIAAEFAQADLARLKLGDLQAADYKAALAKLAMLERENFPHGGCTFAIFRVLEGVQGPWLSLLVGQSPPYDPPRDEQEPAAPPTTTVLKAAKGQVISTPRPYGGFGYGYELSAYAPISGADGKVQAVLAVDYDVSSLKDLREVVSTAFLWAVLPATLMSALVAYFLASNFVEPMELISTIHAAMRGTPRGSLTQLPQATVPSVPIIDSRDSVTAVLPGVPDVPAPPEPAHDATPLPPRKPLEPQVDSLPVGPPTSPQLVVTSPPPSPSVTGSKTVTAVHEETTEQAREIVDARWLTLTAREREVVLFIGQGLTNKKIGELMFVTDETVKRHCKNLFPKLGVKNRTEAALYAIGLGAMTWEPPKGGLE